MAAPRAWLNARQDTIGLFAIARDHEQLLRKPGVETILHARPNRARICKFLRFCQSSGVVCLTGDMGAASSNRRTSHVGWVGVACQQSGSLLQTGGAAENRGRGLGRAR